MTTMPRFTRREFLRTSLIAGGLTLLGGRLPAASAEQAVALPFEHGHRPLVAFPQKRPLMVMTTRPPQLETPFHIFNEGVFTPNDAFFVRWHLAGIPTTIDTATFRLRVRGRVTRELSLTLDDLVRRFESVEVAAVCQCAGNSRGFFKPRVAGGQWGNGAMGNARWRGVRLRDLLDYAGLRADAALVRFNGLDEPVAAGTPDFLKSLPLTDAAGEHVLVAYEMNDEPLPLLNGFPLRLVVPGWYATYWVKMLNDIEVLSGADDNFWTSRAYRLAADPCGCERPDAMATETVPIGRMTVRSFVTSIQDGATIPGGQTVTVKGIAFDRGSGIDRVLFSSDGGRHWTPAILGDDYGDFSFRPWRAQFKPVAGQRYRLHSVAFNRSGESQRMTPRWNRSGYLRNVIDQIQVDAI